ncbi:LptA/OstA family protein [Treponema sp. C6A8]|uniref:LptA/OstA family protein n=1 Tax=Treponema sp. C6A8 TaxID=1410609 RepID=UPI000571F07F|nr:LptA/OstA family protein [Treponema sp. C6A8]
MKKALGIIILLTLLSLPAAAEKITFSADSMSGQAGNSNTTTTMSGNATVSTNSIEIKADSLQLSGEEYRNISANGNISGKNLETNMEFSCDELNYDRITKKIILKGNVKLVDVENNVTCGAQIIEYDQDKDIAIMQIQISLTQKDNVCSGAYAVYYKEQQLLEISGNAQVKQKDDTFRAQFITLDLDTQNITLGGNVKGTVTDTKEKKESESSEEEGAE